MAINVHIDGEELTDIVPIEPHMHGDGGGKNFHLVFETLEGSVILCVPEEDVTKIVAKLHNVAICMANGRWVKP